MIRPVNDRPTFHFAKWTNHILFPPVPENASTIEGKCIKVSVLTRTSQTVMHDLIKNKKGGRLFVKMAAGEAPVDGDEKEPLVTDPDNRRVGLAVTEVPQDPRFGVWQFNSSSNGALQNISIASGMVLLLKPDDCITFRASRGSSSCLLHSRVVNVL